jgi:hypothetical protein
VWNSQNLNGGGAQAALDFRSWLALAADLVWLKNSNGLKWRGLGFCTGTLFEWASPTQKQRLQSVWLANYYFADDSSGLWLRIQRFSMRRNIVTSH